MSLFNLSKKADYGLSMLTLLAARGKGARVSLKELSEVGMPRAFMGQIANHLVQAGILNSREGRGGGYGLNYTPGEIEVGDVLEAIEGGVAPVSCVKNPGSCPVEELCGQRGFMFKFTQEIEEVLARYTLADLIEN